MSISSTYGKSLGFVLRKYPWHDDGVLLVVYSRDYGKINLVHKSMKKREIFGGWTDPFSLIEFSFVKNMQKEYQLLLTADSIEKHASLYESPFLLMYLSVLLEIVDLAFPLHEANTPVYEVIGVFLKHEVSLGETTTQAHLLVILLNLMTLLGWSCPSGIRGDLKVKSFIKKLSTSKSLEQDDLKEVDLLVALTYVLDSLEYLLERPLKSASFLKGMSLQGG